jgi:hypothetical protein
MITANDAPVGPTSPPLIEAPCPGGGDVGANGCAVGGDHLGVSGPQNPIFCPFGSRNGSETAQERLEKRPSSGQGHDQRFS